MLHDKDKTLLALDKEDHDKIYQVDLEKGKIVEEWKGANMLKLVNEYKNANLDNNAPFVGLGG